MPALISLSASKSAMSSYKTAIVQTFSMFCVLHGDQPIWQRDRALQQSLLTLVDDSYQASSEAWARYFLWAAQQDAGVDLADYSPPDRTPAITREIQVIYAQLIARQADPTVRQFLSAPLPQSEQFLSAYLQPCCWYAARQFYYTKIQPSSLRYSYALEDCFQIVSEQSSQPLKLLQNFKLEQDQVKLKTYAETTLKAILQNTLDHAVFKYESPWKLLRYVSKRELTRALQPATDSEITRARLLWYCFKEIYQTQQVRHNRLPPPSETQVQQICDRYRQRHVDLDLPAPISATMVIPSLEAIAQAIRTYRSPQAVLTRLEPEGMTPDPMVELIQTDQLRQVNAIAQVAFAELPEVAQKTLRLWFGLEFNHADILRLVGAELGLQKQYQLSRRLKQYRIKLVKSVIEKSNVEMLEKLRTAPDPERIMEQVLTAIDDYLSGLCKRYFYDALESAVATFRVPDKLLLYAYYQQHLEPSELMCQFNLERDRILPAVETLLQGLRSQLQQWIQAVLDLNLCPYPSLISKLNLMIETWLQTEAVFNL
jgi:hypothetical protein